MAAAHLALSQASIRLSGLDSEETPRMKHAAQLATDHARHTHYQGCQNDPMPLGQIEIYWCVVV
eukprot:4258239-Pyramimonas_sp.AAC.1